MSAVPARLLVNVLLVLGALTACSSGDDAAGQASAATTAVPTATQLPEPITQAYEGARQNLTPVVLEQLPHDDTAFTQGFEFDDQGRLFESTGSPRADVSTLREIDPNTGATIRSIDIPDVFAEGLTIVDDRLIQLTWQAGVAYEYDLETFELLQTFSYTGQGWGLCFDGERLVMSDGSDTLTFRDPTTFEVLGAVSVALDNNPVVDINELECVNGDVWANVWLTDMIMRINPATGTVTGVVDASGLLEPHPAESDGSAVLNGIAAIDGTDTFLVTGKYWPTALEVRFEPVS